MFSSVATDFGSWTKMVIKVVLLQIVVKVICHIQNTTAQSDKRTDAVRHHVTSLKTALLARRKQSLQE